MNLQLGHRPIATSCFSFVFLNPLLKYGKIMMKSQNDRSSFLLNYKGSSFGPKYFIINEESYGCKWKLFFGTLFFVLISGICLYLQETFSSKIVNDEFDTNLFFIPLIVSISLYKKRYSFVLSDPLAMYNSCDCLGLGFS